MDQAAVAAITMASLGMMAAYCLIHGGASGRLIELERATPRTVQFQVDINEADWPELTLLPSIGETLARRIVESRRAEGRFTDVDQLRRVRGVGPKTLEQIRPYLRPIPPAADVADR
jgi:competence protein ComEA